MSFHTRGAGALGTFELHSRQADAAAALSAEIRVNHYIPGTGEIPREGGELLATTLRQTEQTASWKTC